MSTTVQAARRTIRAHRAPVGESMTDQDVPFLAADAARVSATPYSVHLELAAARPDGSVAFVIHLELPSSAAADLATLLATAVEHSVELRAAQAAEP